MYQNEGFTFNRNIIKTLRKQKCLTASVVLQRCPGLQILLSRYKKTQQLSDHRDFFSVKIKIATQKLSFPLTANHIAMTFYCAAPMEIETFNASRCISYHFIVALCIESYGAKRFPPLHAHNVNANTLMNRRSLNHVHHFSFI